MNDEAMVLEENLPDVPHLQDPDRVRLAADRGRGARVGAARARRRLPASPAGARPRHRPARRPRPVRPRAGSFRGACFREPVRSLRRAGSWSLSRADLVSADRPRGDPRARPSGIAGPLRWVEARHAPLDLIGDGRRRRAARRSQATGRSPRSAGSATRRASAARSRRSAARSLGFRTFPDHHPYTPSDVDDLIALGRRPRGRSGLDHPEGFGEAARRAPGPASPCAPCGSGWRSWKGPTRLDDVARSAGQSSRPVRPSSDATGKRLPGESPDDLDATPRPRPRRPAVRATGRPAEQGPLDDLGRPSGPDPTLADWLDSLPDVLAARGLKRLRDAIVQAVANRQARRRGARRARHQDGMRPVPDRLDRTRRALGLALNGSAAIHDLELADRGQDERGRRPAAHGRRRSGSRARPRSSSPRPATAPRAVGGLGEALGEVDRRARRAGARRERARRGLRRGIPLTVHVAIGTDIVHMTPRARRRGARRGDAGRLPDALPTSSPAMAGGRLAEPRQRGRPARGLPQGRLDRPQPRPLARRPDDREPRLRPEIPRPPQRPPAPRCRRGRTDGPSRADDPAAARGRRGAAADADRDLGRSARPGVPGVPESDRTGSRSTARR